MKEIQKQAPRKPFDLESIKDIIADDLGVNRDTVNDSSDLIQDLGADSIDIVGLTLRLEQELDCVIPINDTAKLTTPKDVYNYLSES